MAGHHLILGTLKDFLTGDPLDDTLDERHRQAIARLLVREKQFKVAEIVPRYLLRVKAGDQTAGIRVDFALRLDGQWAMIVKYGPGSLTTRHRPALAASRLIADYQIPLVVVTNGETAEVLDGYTGKLLGGGFAAIPSRSQLLEHLTTFSGAEPISRERAEKEARILFAFEVDDRCPCDDDICRF